MKKSEKKAKRQNKGHRKQNSEFKNLLKNPRLFELIGVFNAIVDYLLFGNLRLQYSAPLAGRLNHKGHGRHLFNSVRAFRSLRRLDCLVLLLLCYSATKSFTHCSNHANSYQAKTTRTKTSIYNSQDHTYCSGGAILGILPLPS